MTQPPIIPSQAMPSATILNYVGRRVEDQPTRVRTIAFWCLLAYCLFPLLLAGYCWLRFGRELLYSFPFFGDPSSLLLLFILSVTMTSIAVLVLISSNYVRLGRPWACVVGLLFIYPILLLCIVIAGFLGAYSLLEVVTPMRGTPQYQQLVWLAFALFFAFLTLIANDLGRYLFWIYRLPRQEKPPIKFIG